MANWVFAGHAAVNIDNLTPTASAYDPWQRYGASKLANSEWGQKNGIRRCCWRYCRPPVHSSQLRVQSCTLCTPTSSSLGPVALRRRRREWHVCICVCVCLCAA
jgi:hypothetical protein